MAENQTFKLELKQQQKKNPSFIREINALFNNNK